MADQIRVAVVDDHPLFRRGVVLTLKSERDLDVVAEGASAEDAVEIARGKKPDVMLLDVNMPGGGIEAVRALRDSAPDIKCIVLTVSENEGHLTDALAAGAQGYILKGIGGNELVAMVRTIASGEPYVTPSLAARVLQRLQATPPAGRPADQRAELTEREEQILVDLAAGSTNKEIARRLQLSEKTIKHHVTSILQKLQVRNRVEAALTYQRQQNRS